MQTWNSAVANFLALYLGCFAMTIFLLHSLPINAQLYTSKDNNCQPGGTVPRVFAVPGARTVKNMVLG